MKKILSVLLIISTLFLSLGFQSCFAKNAKEENVDQISQFAILETKHKNQSNTIKKAIKSIFSNIFSFLSSTVLGLFSSILGYCIIYGSLGTLVNLNEAVEPSVDVPVRFIPTDTKFFEFLKEVAILDDPDTTVPINLGCLEPMPDLLKEVFPSFRGKNSCDLRFDFDFNNFEITISESSVKLKKPLEKWMFFTCFDAPCSLLRLANKIYNNIKG